MSPSVPNPAAETLTGLTSCNALTHEMLLSVTEVNRDIRKTRMYSIYLFMLIYILATDFTSVKNYDFVAQLISIRDALPCR